MSNQASNPQPQYPRPQKNCRTTAFPVIYMLYITCLLQDCRAVDHVFTFNIVVL